MWSTTKAAQGEGRALPRRVPASLEEHVPADEAVGSHRRRVPSGLAVSAVRVPERDALVAWLQSVRTGTGKAVEYEMTNEIATR